MRLMRLGERGQEIPVVVVDGTTLDARGITDDFHPEFFAGDGLERLRAAVESGALPHHKGTDERIGIEILRDDGGCRTPCRAGDLANTARER